MEQEKYSDYRIKMINILKNDFVSAGYWKEEGSYEKAVKEQDDVLPHGPETKNHYLNEIIISVDNKESICGHIWTGHMPDMQKDEVFLFYIEIFPDNQKKGFASEALKQVEKLMAENGFKTMFLGVFKNNASAINLYKKTGYTIRNEHEHGFHFEKKINYMI
jgi:ribosomal protein S18 acetylase RimI-like enzyme